MPPPNDFCASRSMQSIAWHSTNGLPIESLVAYVSVTFEGLRGVFLSARGVLLVFDLNVLLKYLGRDLGRLGLNDGLATEVAAHKEDKGKNIATRVRTLESMEGRLTVYSRTEKIAMLCD